MSKVLAAAASALLYVAIHLIEYSENGKRKTAQPGSIFAVPEADEAFLVRQGSVRKPTEAEIALYEKQNPPKKAAVASTDATKTGRAAKGSNAASGASAGAGEGAGEGADEGGSNGSESVV